MRKWDLLLEWMTHLGSGTWSGFREAVFELTRSEADEGRSTRMLRAVFSDLGHADFFVDGSRRWRVLQPALVGLSDRNNYLFVGGRTRRLLERLCSALSSSAAVTLTEDLPGLSQVRVVGDPQFIAAVAEVEGVQHVPDSAARMCASLPSIKNLLDSAAPALEPINWSARYWSFKEERWTNDKQQQTVREYSNRYGVRRYFADLGRAGLIEVDRRTAIYCAALAKGTRIAKYGENGPRLRVPRWAPLPELYARVACLASGRHSAVTDQGIVYENVDPSIASNLLVSLGQGFPMPKAKAK